jgi:hypothetical protein
MTPPVKRYDIRSHGNGFPPDVYERAAGVWVSGADYDALAAQMAGLRAERDDYRQRWTDTSIALRALACQPHAPNDHMTACDRTMGDSHPCTCTANDARVMLAAVLPAPPAATTVKP